MSFNQRILLKSWWSDSEYPLSYPYIGRETQCGRSRGCWLSWRKDETCSQPKSPGSYWSNWKVWASQSMHRWDCHNYCLEYIVWLLETILHLICEYSQSTLHGPLWWCYYWGYKGYLSILWSWWRVTHSLLWSHGKKSFHCFRPQACQSKNGWSQSPFQRDAIWSMENLLSGFRMHGRFQGPKHCSN